MRIFDLIHPVATLGLSLLFALFGHAWLGGLLGAVWFVSREQTQAEYRWIQTFGENKRANFKVWDCLDPRIWDTHSLVFNLGLPVAVAVLVIVL